MAQLLMSHDQGVWKAADIHLIEENQKQGIKFKPAALDDTISKDNFKQQSSDGCSQDPPCKNGG